MNVAITVASIDDRERVAALFELYVYDWSELLALDVGENGRFAVPALDAYWTERGHHPFLIRVDDKLAGFALVRDRSRLTGTEGVHDMAELFVMRRHRRAGVGARAAGFLFDRFRGPWEVRQRPENGEATAFWRKVIASYTGGRFEDVVWHDDHWKGPVQRFET